MLEERGEMPVDELIGALASTVGAKKSSITSSAHSHPFVIQGETISMREKPEPVEGCPY
jgi:hypothetical protein